MIEINIRTSLRKVAILVPKSAVTIAIFHMLFLMGQKGNLEAKATLQDTTIIIPQLHTKGSPDPGVELFKKKKFQEALESFQKRIIQEPENWSLHFNIGCICMIMRKYNKALDAFKSVSKLKPDHAHAYYLQGACYRVIGDNSQAKAAFQKALDLDPKNKDARKQLEIQNLLELREKNR